MSDLSAFADQYRYPDQLLGRILRGCQLNEEWWGRHPTLPVHVSNLGRVRGVRGKVLSPYGQNGYPAVDVLGRRYKVAVLVLQTFIGDCPDGLECCHWDDDPLNNRLTNLRWDTHSANQYDYLRNVREGRVKSPHFARRRTINARKLAVLDRLEEMAQ